MAKRYDFTRRNRKTNKLENTGYMEIKGLAAGGYELHIYGDIIASGWERISGDDVCPQDIADFLGQIPVTSELTVYINSGGGDAFAGIAIHNILSRHTGYKRGVVDGLAASIASVILMACDEIELAAGAQIMIHKPLTFAYGNADDLQSCIDTLNKCQQSITDIYMQKARDGITEERITELINAETWMSGKEVGEIFDIKISDHPAVAACVSWMMDSYMHKPDGIEIKAIDDAETSENDAAETAILAELDLFGV